MHSEVGIVGCGLIGVSWAALFRVSGRNVHAWDSSPEVLETFAARVEAIVPDIETLSLFPPRPPGTLVTCTSLADLARRSSFIQESVPEQDGLKQQLYREIELETGEETIIASSTSSLSWPELP